MQRIARHPVIQNSEILKNFLESTDMVRKKIDKQKNK